MFSTDESDENDSEQPSCVYKPPKEKTCKYNIEVAESCVEELSSPTHEMAKEHDNLAQLEVEARNDFQANLDSIGQHDTFLIQETERCNIQF